jgi:hypothetical protein
LAAAQAAINHGVIATSKSSTRRATRPALKRGKTAIRSRR